MRCEVSPLPRVSARSGKIKIRDKKRGAWLPGNEISVVWYFISLTSHFYSCLQLLGIHGTMENPIIEAKVRLPGGQNIHPPIFQIMSTPSWEPIIGNVEHLVKL